MIIRVLKAIKATKELTAPMSTLALEETKALNAMTPLLKAIKALEAAMALNTTPTLETMMALVRMMEASGGRKRLAGSSRMMGGMITVQAFLKGTDDRTTTQARQVAANGRESRLTGLARCTSDRISEILLSVAAPDLYPFVRHCAFMFRHFVSSRAWCCPSP